MDYGYQLLRHAVQQVFGNLGSAARLTLLLAVIPTLFFAMTNPALLTGGADPTRPFDPALVNWGAALFGVALSVLCWCWAAVAWHRFVLLEEYPGGALPPWNGPRILSYFGRTVLVTAVVAFAAFGLSIALGVMVTITRSMLLAATLGVGLVIGISWVGTRIGLILPAAAIGAPLRISESWAATAPVSGHILVPIVVIALVAGVVSQAIVLALGAGLPAALIGLGVFWIQLLINLALMTTLYGNLVEGRQLN